jgi:mannose-1-phosphate guanylyltransferase
VSSLYVLILAGGSGERFWPLSRKARPKQLLSLFADSTLLGDTLDRLRGLVPAENILILTNANQEQAVREIASELPGENIVAEPAKRDTAAAIALGAAWVVRRDPSATMVVLPADHLIKDTESFHQTINAAVAAAQQTGALVTIGIKPTWACPGFGYIEKANPVSIAGAPEGADIREVVSFREKPNPELAGQFLSKGNFDWNAGMFIWTLPAILSAFERYVPELAEFVAEAQKNGDLGRIVEAKFSTLPKISIDYAVMEKAARVLVVEAVFDWDDVGSWPAVAKYLDHDAGGNASNTPLTVIESQNNIVFSKDKLRIALMGVHDLIVVQTGDALLVCRREQAEHIKQVVGQIPPELQ